MLRFRSLQLFHSCRDISHGLLEREEFGFARFIENVLNRCRSSTIIPGRERVIIGLFDRRKIPVSREFVGQAQTPITIEIARAPGLLDFTDRRSRRRLIQDAIFFKL